MEDNLQKDNLQWKKILEWKMIFYERQPLKEYKFWGETTFKEQQPLWKMTFNGIPLIQLMSIFDGPLPLFEQ